MLRENDERRLIVDQKLAFILRFQHVDVPRKNHALIRRDDGNPYVVVSPLCDQIILLRPPNVYVNFTQRTRNAGPHVFIYEDLHAARSATCNT
jgi:hypothetical protein